MGDGFFFSSFLTSVSDVLTLDTHMELHLGNLHATNSLPESKWVGSLLEKRPSVVRYNRKRPLAVSGH